MFKENDDHEQEKLFSPIKDLDPALKKKLDEHWSSDFYEHVFTQIDETKFADLYHDGYSRPNKPVNELASLEIIKYIRGYSDEELADAYIFDLTVRHALGKEMPDNISPNTFTNFRRRLLEHEEETGRSLLDEVFAEHREYFIEEFDLDASTQRMDSTFIEANIKQLSRIDLIAKVLHNFLGDLPEELLGELPAGIAEFAGRENLNLSYRLAPGEAEKELETLAEYAGWIVDRFEHDGRFNDLQSFEHLRRVLDEQCYRIPELEADEEEVDLADHGDDDDDDDSPGWEPARKRQSGADDPETRDGDETETADRDESEGPTRVGLKDSDEIDSGSLQNPHDDEATYRDKNGEAHIGYIANLAETCANDDEFRLITSVQVDTNNTEDTELLDEIVEELAEETGLRDLLNDGGYLGEDVESTCTDTDVTQHFTGIKGRRPDPDTISIADADWEGREMVACPAGYEPSEQEYTPKNERYRGRFDKEICGNCPYQEECFVEERQQFCSYGFYDRELVTARRRARLADPEEREFLNLRAGAESMINEVWHKTGKQTKFTGRIKVKNTAIATAIGTNLKRAARAGNEATASGEKAAA